MPYRTYWTERRKSTANGRQDGGHLQCQDGGHENVIGDGVFIGEGCGGCNAPPHTHPPRDATRDKEYLINNTPKSPTPRQWIHLLPMTFSWPPSWRPFVAAILAAICSAFSALAPNKPYLLWLPSCDSQLSSKISAFWQIPFLRSLPLPLKLLRDCKHVPPSSHTSMEVTWHFPLCAVMPLNDASLCQRGPRLLAEDYVTKWRFTIGWALIV